MTLPKLFIGSSKKNVEVSNLVAMTLHGKEAWVKVWDEGVFGMNESFLHSLLNTVKEYEYAAFVIAGDDMTTSKDESKPSPRDNVLFESGLFMGALGPNNVFLIYDESIEVKIPSDLHGITLASYDGSRIKEGIETVRTACYLISKKIKEQAERFPNLRGKWKSIYPVPYAEGTPQATEVVVISAYRDGITIVTIENSENDYYEATGRIIENKIVGEWNSRKEDSVSRGVFTLSISADGKFMYGYFTAPDERGGVMYAYWILAKNKEGDEATMDRNLNRGKKMLTSSTIAMTLGL